MILIFVEISRKLLKKLKPGDIILSWVTMVKINFLHKESVFVNSKELRRLSRRELVDIIYQMKKNEQQMQDKIAALEEELKDKRLRISSAGSVAEAAADVTDILSKAQETADLYLNEIAFMKEEAKKECVKMIEDVKRRIENVLDSDNNQNTLSTQYISDYKKLTTLQAMQDHIGGSSEEINNEQ